MVATIKANPQGYQTLGTKYATVYPYDGTSEDNRSNYTAYKNLGYGYGDATLETSLIGHGDTSWYNEYSYFFRFTAPFMLRGSYFGNKSHVVIFSFDYYDGNSHPYYSFRSVLVGA